MLLLPKPTEGENTMLRLSWGICLVASLAMLVGILVVTRDLAVTNSTFKDGVVQAKKVNSTTDTALGAGLELPPAQQAVLDGMPEVGGVISSLGNANSTLTSLSTQLDGLGSTLASADKPLVDIIGAASSSTGIAADATTPAREIVGKLSAADQRIKQLDPMLDETLERSMRIERKLRILRALPK
jgi:hypothetical protein